MASNCAPNIHAPNVLSTVVPSSKRSPRTFIPRFEGVACGLRMVWSPNGMQLVTFVYKFGRFYGYSIPLWASSMPIRAQAVRYSHIWRKLLRFAINFEGIFENFEGKFS